MPDMDRRLFLKFSAVTATASSLGLSSLDAAASQSPIIHSATEMDVPKSKGQRTVVIGGGVSGLTIARYLCQAAPDMQVILLERNATYQFCPISNLYLVHGIDLGYFCRSYLDAARKGGYIYVQSTVYDA